ncbi:SDR family NAD(P)-dependent oxidoreductase [Mycobacterium simiae]|nr:SDR family oxidoreductase [Mycobacterium simiae]
MTREFALVTGASCGVGFAVAKRLAERGYDLIVADGYQEIDTAADTLAVLGTDVAAVQAHIHRADQARLLHRCAKAADGRLVVAALSVPILDACCLDDSLDSALNAVDTSVRATMLLARLLGGEMAANGGGSIVVTGSPADPVPGLDWAVYTASSALLRAFVATLHNELRDCGVKVTAVMPDPCGQGGVADILSGLVGRAATYDAADIARQALASLTSDDWSGLGARATDAMSALARRLIGDGVTSPVRHLISPTGAAV